MMLVQANMIGTTPLQLVALAAYRAVRDHPEAFGRIANWDEAERKREAQRTVRAGRAALAGGEIRYGEIDATSRALVTIDGVPVAPAETLGERLCQAAA